MTSAPLPGAAADRYLTERVMTASPAELTAMLYDACVAALTQAARLQDDGQHVAALRPIRKAQDILLELRTTLDHARGGELAPHLDSLYTWGWGRLLDAATHRDAAATRQALAVVQPLQQAWRESCLTTQVA